MSAIAWTYLRADCAQRDHRNTHRRRACAWVSHDRAPPAHRRPQSRTYIWGSAAFSLRIPRSALSDVVVIRAYSRNACRNGHIWGSAASRATAWRAASADWHSRRLSCTHCSRTWRPRVWPYAFRASHAWRSVYCNDGRSVDAAGAPGQRVLDTVRLHA